MSPEIKVNKLRKKQEICTKKYNHRQNDCKGEKKQKIKKQKGKQRAHCRIGLSVKWNMELSSELLTREEYAVNLNAVLFQVCFPSKV